jgi:hypothetical protein
MWMNLENVMFSEITNATCSHLSVETKKKSDSKKQRTVVSRG